MIDDETSVVLASGQLKDIVRDGVKEALLSMGVSASSPMRS